MTKKDTYFAYLEGEGYRPKADSDGDITFKSEGMVFLLYANESDSEYFRLAMPSIWTIGPNQADKSAAVAAANVVSAAIKVAKVITVENTVWINAEMFFAKPEDALPIITRTLGALRAAARRFLEEMQPPTATV